MYSVQLTGVIATKAASLLVTNMKGLTDGLDLGIAILFLPGKGYNTRCDDQNRAAHAVQSESLAIISTLSLIMAILLILLLITVIYLR